MTTERDTGSAQTALINAVIEKAVPALITAREALDRFHAMMRSKDKERLDPWIAMAAETKLAAFAAGVEADKDAIAAAISTPWSSGQVEGKVNRLKAIKRQMYGRAKIDLLRPELWRQRDPLCTEFESDPKRDPFALRGSVDAGGRFRAAGGAGRA